MHKISTRVVCVNRKHLSSVESFISLILSFQNIFTNSPLYA